MSKLRFPKEILQNRLIRFQNELSRNKIDAAMIRVQSTYTYFTGTRWLRPALLIPSEGTPLLFAVKNEEEELMQRTWIDEVITFADARELMAKVSGVIRNRQYRRVGLEFGIERDAYIAFYEMFKLLNPRVEIIDISQIIAQMRMIKDKYELDAIRNAGKIAMKILNKIDDFVKIGASETDIAAEIYYLAYKYGSEEPKVYINIGPNPRVHSEPFKDNILENGGVTTIIMGIDYNNYYVNVSRTITVGQQDDEVDKALECMMKVYDTARELTKSEIKPIQVIKELDKIYEDYGYLENRVVGYLHGVGLQVEEYPITTILPRHRMIKLVPNMSVAFIHTPLMIKGIGQIKHEDTFIITDKGLEPITI